MKKKKNDFHTIPGGFTAVVESRIYSYINHINSYLSVSKVIKDGGQFLGAGVLTLGDDGRVGIPPVHREPMEPHFSLLQVRLLQAGIEAVDLTS